MSAGLRFAVLGAGATGTRLARQLVSTVGVDEVVLRDDDAARVDAVVHALGPAARSDGGAYHDPLDDVDVVVCAGPAGTHGPDAAAHLRAGRPVVSTGDAIEDVRAVLDLAAEAAERGLPVVAGAGFGPGLTDVLAMHAAAGLDEVHEVHVARCGTGGPACARQHHRALAGEALDWRDGGWARRPGGSGRELCWFPDPVGPRDCYRAALPDALLLVDRFPGVRRVTTRQAATRRDRLTARLPMIRPPHAEGGPGAVRVEVRGRRGSSSETVVLGALDRPAVAAGAVAAVVALWIADGRIAGAGARGVAGFVDPVPFLTDLRARGVRAAVFEPAAVA